jgi:hypothetical protein
MDKWRRVPWIKGAKGVSINLNETKKEMFQLACSFSQMARSGLQEYPVKKTGKMEHKGSGKKA